MNEKKAAELKLKNDDLVKIIVNNDKGGEMEAFVKIKSKLSDKKQIKG